MKKSIVFTGIILSACATTNDQPAWHAQNYYDEFTEEQYCRVEATNPRKLYSAWTHNYAFFVETKDGALRTGFRSDRNIPIIGDIQIKVGEKLVTMTAMDTPIDVSAQNFQLDESHTMASTINQLTENISKMGSPYRAFEGDKATSLLKDVLAHEGEIKYRVVSTNKALSTTGFFIVDDSFKKALNQCHIKI